MPQAFEFRLTVLGLQKSWIYVIPVRPEPVVIGRQAGLDLVLEHQHVSRNHAALYCTDVECMLVDLNSANGTRLNGQKLKPQVPVALKPGDSIQIGAFNLDFEQIPFRESSEPVNANVPETSIFREHVPVPSQPVIPPSVPPYLPPVPPAAEFDPSKPPPGLTFRSDRLLGYLPGIYHTDFMASFLGIFESILFPIEWQIDNFDLFLDPGTAPAGFLSWLANWFNIVFDTTWNEKQRRAFLKEAYAIYSRYGTKWALTRMLEIYTGRTPEIDDQSADLEPHTFRVRLPAVVSLDRASIERLIDACKPIHTAYILEMKS